MPATALRSETAAESDRDALLRLNRDYIDCVQNSDVGRFEELLAEDFLCSHPDGSLVDRATFLEQTARPVAIRNLAAQEVKIRLMGDFAIIHARTSYLKPDGAPGQGRSPTSGRGATEAGSASRPMSRAAEACAGAGVACSCLGPDSRLICPAGTAPLPRR
jgi:Domain of unknown function (DUF4440)